IVSARLWGPAGEIGLRLALDTGASHTCISQTRLLKVGYDPSMIPDRCPVTMGGSVEFVPQLTVDRIFALETERNNLSVLAHTLPPSARVDGLLGLDFLRGLTLTVDFRGGLLNLI